MNNWSLAVSIVVPMCAFIIGAWKFLYNHIEHLKDEIRADLAEIRADLRDLRDHLIK